MAKRNKNINKKQKIKRKLKKELSAVKTLKYKTTFKDIKKYFKLINSHVFDGKLSPFNDVQLVNKPRSYIGQVVVHDKERKGTRSFTLEMLKSYSNKKEFVDTLGHEMIHLFQMQNMGDTGNHNDVFYSFRPKLNAIGLDI
tara:strand:+ start:2092 stop:2514 length:423 start_codon:yes stop_codon:yes gene_type:complete